MADIPKNSVALAGEYAVLSQLMLRGFDAAMTLGNTKRVDILAHHANSGRMLKIEVKTNLENRLRPTITKLFGAMVTGWQMDIKHESIEDPDLYYSLVHFAPDRQNRSQLACRIFNVPSVIVATYVRETHVAWMKADATHKDTTRRFFRLGADGDVVTRYPAPRAALYENNWDFELPRRGKARK